MWWPWATYKTSKDKHNKLLRLASLVTTGATKTTSTAADNDLLRLLPLHLKMQAQTLAGIYKLSWNAKRKPKSTWPQIFRHEDHI
jgi:hypothetical protein